MMPPRHPSQATLRRGETATWGQRPATKPPPSAAPRTAKIKKFTPFRNEAGTVLGFFSIDLPSGLIIHDCKLMCGPKGGRWVALPSIKRLDHDGNPRLDPHGKAMWSPIVEFVDRPTQDRFRDMVLDVLRSQHPDLFEGEP